MPIADAMDNSATMQVLTEIARLEAENEHLRTELARLQHQSGGWLAWAQWAYDVLLESGQHEYILSACPASISQVVDKDN